LRTHRPDPSGYTVGGVPTAQTPRTSKNPFGFKTLALVEKITEWCVTTRLLGRISMARIQWSSGISTVTFGVGK
jgi:hypothetical protein